MCDRKCYQKHIDFVYETVEKIMFLSRDAVVSLLSIIYIPLNIPLMIRHSKYLLVKAYWKQMIICGKKNRHMHQYGIY